jgi:hypothetical protein
VGAGGGGADAGHVPGAQGGGQGGRYARAYLSLLDGIAHIGFVAAGGPPAYYSDALGRLGTALQLAGEVGATDVQRGATQWLARLSVLTGLTPGPAAQTIQTAAEALLRLHAGIGPGPAARDAPEIPWYDEGYIFPV